MSNNQDKRCPNCGGEIDFFGTCRRCGREWSETLEEGEKAVGLAEGEQHQAKIEKKPKKTASKKSTSKFSWMIEDSDDETEIVRKRSLMRLDSRRLYNSLGLASRAYDTQKGTMQWLKYLFGFLNEEEQKALVPTVELLKRAIFDLEKLKQSKIKEASAMEIALEKAHSQARKARLRSMAKQKKAAIKQIKPHEDTEGFSNPEPVTLDPKFIASSEEELIELAKERLANLDQEKALSKRKKEDGE